MAGILGPMIPDYIGKTQRFYKNAIDASAARSDKYKDGGDGKTVGGGIMAAAGGAAAGTTVLPGWGTAIGGIVGLLGYALG